MCVPGDLCERVAGGAHARIHVPVPLLPQLAGKTLIHQQAHPDHAGADLTHEPEVVHTHTHTSEQTGRLDSQYGLLLFTLFPIVV